MVTHSLTPRLLCDWTDLDLAAAVVLHRNDAYAELYRRHVGAVAAVSRMILGRGTWCDDVVAEVFLGFWLAPEKFEPERGTVVAFLRMKARGRSIDVVRSEAARRRRELDVLGAGTEAAPAPDAAFLTLEAARSVRRALAQLPQPEREPISLAFFAGMTYVDIALHLGLPEGTVKSRIRTGLLRMRSAVEHGGRHPVPAALVDGGPSASDRSGHRGAG